MYNRYIPQPDGSFRRNSTPENCPQPQTPPRPAPPPPCAPEPAYPGADQTPSPKPCPGAQSIGSFFKNLLPKGFDTADLLIVVLLLLMAGDSQEDQNCALLTLALYLFM
jgi:hypothetical protein